MVTASFGNYTGTAQLSGGQYSLTIPGGTLPVGADTITVSYIGDSHYASSATSTIVNVTQWIQIVPTVTVTPAATTIGASQQLSVAVAISGSSGQGSGFVTLSSGAWNSGAQAVINGTANISIPSNTLTVGTDTLTASYSGDPTYLAATTTTTITVNPSTFTLAAGNGLIIAPGQQGVETITAKTPDGYSGTITLSCALTSEPSGAVNLPTCSGDLISMIGASANSGDVTVNTTAANAFLTHPLLPGLGGFGGAVLAFFVFLGTPARRRGWRNLLGVFILFFTLTGLNACGGGGSNGGGGGGGGGGNSGTTAGTYTFTVTGTGNPAVTPVPTTVFTLTVN